MAAKKVKAKAKKAKARFEDRHLVQALVDKDLLDWIKKMATERDLRVGSYVRALIRWAKDTQVGDLDRTKIQVRRRAVSR